MVSNPDLDNKEAMILLDDVVEVLTLQALDEWPNFHEQAVLTCLH